MMSEYRYAQTNIQLQAQLRELGYAEADLARVAAGYALVIRLFTGQFRSSGKPFVAHLVGTASIVAAHGGSVDEVLAALTHAVYDAGDFGSPVQGWTAAKQRQLRDAIGDRAEAIVADYFELEWIGKVQPDVIHRRDEVIADKRSAMFLGICNEMEEAVDGGFRFGHPRRLEDLENSIETIRAFCPAMGLDALLAEIEETVATYVALPAVPVSDNPPVASYMLPPMSLTIRPGLRLILGLRGVWRLLTPRGLRARVKDVLRVSG